MDDEFQGMLQAVVASNPAVHITALVNRMDQTRPVDRANPDETVRVRYCQIRASVHKLCEHWRDATESEIQRQAESGESRDFVQTNCGKIEFALILLSFYCHNVLHTCSPDSFGVLRGLVDAHRQGVENASLLPVATQIRRLMLTSSSLETALPSTSDYVPAGSPAPEKVQKMVIVLEQLQARLSAYTRACGADLIIPTMRLVTMFAPAGVLGGADVRDRSW